MSPDIDREEFLKGTLELLVLKTLSLEPMHGWGISQRIRHLSRETFSVPQGSLYPALQRMKRDGLITSEWRTTENSRRARYYMLTKTGTRRLEDERRSWARASSAVNWILDAAGGET